MTDFEIQADAAGVAAAAAERIASVAATGGHIALAGGSTPERAYELLRDADLSAAALWFSDDRAVGPQAPDSNYGMAARSLLDHLAEPHRPSVHRIEGELGPEAAADRYEALVRAEVGEQPRFDLILLGLGPDAHTASLFQGKPAVGESERLVVAVPEAGMEPWVPRVTFTLPLLNAAREVLFLVAGADKAPAVARAFNEPADPASPAARVRPDPGRLVVMLDEKAAAGIDR
ncbi:MAG: 6-phosphogluconolactonase [Solirubrobacterales bacterium]|nr:6-phosphogluconolactonase [Solirubrobacterales bacterium]